MSTVKWKYCYAAFSFNVILSTSADIAMLISTLINEMSCQEKCSSVTNHSFLSPSDVDQCVKCPENHTPMQNTSIALTKL